MNTGDSNGEADDGASDIGSDCPCPELEGGVVWTICPNGASSTEQNDHEPKESEAADSAASVTVSGEQFKDVPAFVFLDNIGLTQLPNRVGVGVSFHGTTKVWQVRYPADDKQSTARTFGHVKGKGHVSSCAALIQCLLWSWQQHAVKNPSCPVSKEVHAHAV